MHTLEELRPGLHHYHVETIVTKRDKNNRAIEKNNIVHNEVDTPIGKMDENMWLKEVLAIVEEDKNVKKLFEDIKAYCGKNCAWLKSDGEIIMHSAQCLCHGSYKHWEDFEYEEVDSVFCEEIKGSEPFSGVNFEGDIELLE